MYTSIHIHIYTHINLDKYESPKIYIYIYTHILICEKNTHIHIYTHIYKYELPERTEQDAVFLLLASRELQRKVIITNNRPCYIQRLYIHIYMYSYVYIYIYMNICVYIYVYICIYMIVDIFTCL